MVNYQKEILTCIRFWLITAVCLIPAIAMAQPPVGIVSALQLGGMTKEEVQQRFGKPDEIIQSSAELETWRYSESKVWFQSGKVTLWDDNSETLARRSSEQKFFVKEKQLSYGVSEKGWINDWTPSDEPAPERVIENLFEE